MSFYPGDTPGPRRFPGAEFVNPSGSRPSTRRVWEALPEHYQHADEHLISTGEATPYPLLRYLSLITDQLDDVVTAAEALDPETSPTGVGLLGDPANAPAEWLPWIARMLGIQPPSTITTDRLRWLIANVEWWRYPGTVGHIIDAVRVALIPLPWVTEAYIRVERDPATPWHLTVYTAPEETPDAQAVLDAINAADARPAGTRLTLSTYRASWDVIEQTATTWDAIEALGSWSNLESTHL